MLIETLLISMLLAVLINKSIKWIDHIELKWAAAAFAAFFIEVVLNVACNFGSRFMIDWVCDYSLYFQMVIYYLLIVFVLRNFKVNGMLIIGIGFILNAAVIFANKGFMPVDTAMGLKYNFEHTLYDLHNQHIFGHIILNPLTKLTFLADVINVPPPYPWPKTISVGDIFIDIGVIVMVLSACFQKDLLKKEDKTV